MVVMAAPFRCKRSGYSAPLFSVLDPLHSLSAARHQCSSGWSGSGCRHRSGRSGCRTSPLPLMLGRWFSCPVPGTSARFWSPTNSLAATEEWITEWAKSRFPQAIDSQSRNSPPVTIDGEHTVGSGHRAGHGGTGVAVGEFDGGAHDPQRRQTGCCHCCPGRSGRDRCRGRPPPGTDPGLRRKWLHGVTGRGEAAPPRLLRRAPASAPTR